MSTRIHSILLFAGIAAGATLAAAGLLEGPAAGTDPPAGVVAVVGDEPIAWDDYARALRAVSAERRTPLSAEQQRHVLERLIDEELLVQRGLELGLAGRDPRLRAELSAAVIGLLVAQAELQAEQPDMSALVAFYEANAAMFRAPARYRIEHLFVAVDGRADDGEARNRAEALAVRLRRGEPASELASAADALVAEPPDDWLSGSTIQRYLGPSVARVAAALDEGAVSEPVRSFGGYTVVRMVARRAGALRAFDEVEAEVRDTYRRRAGERAVERFLEARRRVVPVVVAEERL